MLGLSLRSKVTKRFKKEKKDTQQRSSLCPTNKFVSAKYCHSIKKINNETYKLLATHKIIIFNKKKEKVNIFKENAMHDDSPQLSLE